MHPATALRLDARTSPAQRRPRIRLLLTDAARTGADSAWSPCAGRILGEHRPRSSLPADRYRLAAR